MPEQGCDQCDEFTKMWEGAKLLSGSDDPSIIQNMFDTTSGADLITAYEEAKFEPEEFES